jgi:hypothetical protein
MAINLGEATVTLDGRTYDLRLSLGDLKILERTLGSALKLWKSILAAEIAVTEIEAVLVRAVTTLARATHDPISDADIRRLVGTIPAHLQFTAVRDLVGGALNQFAAQQQEDQEEEDHAPPPGRNADPLSSRTEH